MAAERILAAASSISVEVRDDGTAVINTPNAQPEGIVLKAGEKVGFRFSTAVHVVGYIPGVGYDDNLSGAYGEEIDRGERPALGGGGS